MPISAPAPNNAILVIRSASPRIVSPDNFSRSEMETRVAAFGNTGMFADELPNVTVAFIGTVPTLTRLKVDAYPPPITACGKTKVGCASDTGMFEAMAVVAPGVLLSTAAKPSEDRTRTGPVKLIATRPRTGMVSDCIGPPAKSVTVTLAPRGEGLTRM